MNDILKDIESAEQQTHNTIKIITDLQDTIAKLSKDDAISETEISQFEEETEYLKKLAQKVANGLTPPVPNSSLMSIDPKIKDIKSVICNPKFIKAKQTRSNQFSDNVLYDCTKQSSKLVDIKSAKQNQNKTTMSLQKSSNNSLTADECLKEDQHVYFHAESTLQPTKYLEHFLIPINKMKLENISTQSMPNSFRPNKEIPHGTYSALPMHKSTFGEVWKRPSPVENFAKLMELCMNVKEERETELEKQIYTLEEEMHAVIESNKNLYRALEKLEEQNTTRRLVRDSSTNTLSDITISQMDDVADIPYDSTFLTPKTISNDLAENILKCIHADIQEITDVIEKSDSKENKSILHSSNNEYLKPPKEIVKHVSFLENAITSMQIKLENAQSKRVELVMQSKAVVEAAHRMTNGS